MYQAVISATTSLAPAMSYDPSPAATQERAGVDVTITNTSNTTWPATDVFLYYRWYSADAEPVVSTSAPISLGGDVPPGSMRTVRVIESPPSLPEGVDKAQYRLQFDLYHTAASTWFAGKGNQPLENPVIINKKLKAEALGLEKYYHYVGEDVGAGMQHLLNIANGNSLLRWTPFQAPGRGLATVVDLTYNSLEQKSESPIGNNFSLSISGLTRFGQPLDIHPNKADEIAGNAQRWIAFTDGDGTTHRFEGQQAADGTVYWQEPPGVHLYLRTYSTTDPARKWALTRPDRVTFFFDAEGYPTSVEDLNGNRLTFTLQAVPPGDDPGGPKKRITAITDAAGQGAAPAPNRQFVVEYYTKTEVKKAQVRGKIQRITDHTGSALEFTYYEDGNLLRMTQRGGVKADGSLLADRSFVFTYTTPNGAGPAIPNAADRVNPNPKTPSQSTHLFSVRDPRGSETRFAYCGTQPGTTCDPDASQNRWKLRTRTNRLGSVTAFAYDITTRVTTVTAPLTRISTYAYDIDGKVTSITNPLNQVTQVQWTTDRMVAKVTEPTGAYTEFAYNANGYLTDRWDQLRNRTTVEYQNLAVDANDVSGKWAAGRTIPHISQPITKTEPKGTATASPTDDYQWSFGYDAKGNLIRVADPVQRGQGTATTYVYNGDGTLQSMTDANGQVTRYTSYDANGLVTTQVDAKNQTTTLGYDADGLLRWIQDPSHAAYTTGDPRGYRTYFDYDSFHRLGRQSAPKSTATATGTLIWSGADYDANDNLILQIGPHYGTNYTYPGGGARTTMTYDVLDRRTLMTGPDTSVDPAGERTAYEYDAENRLTRMTQPKGVLTPNTPNDFAQFTDYDPLDRVVRQYRHAVDANGVITETHYTHLCYDLAGDLRTTTAPKAQLSTVNCAAPPSYTTKYEYDAAHKRTKQIDPLGHTETTQYDANDNVIGVTNVHGHTETREYDQRDHVVKTIQPFVTAAGQTYTLPPSSYTGPRPRTITTTRSYDPVGNLIAQVSPRGWDASADKTTFADYVTKYTYDALNQLVRIELPSESSERTANKQQYIHRAYDANGRLQWSSLPVEAADAAAVSADKKTTQEYWDPGWIRTSKEGSTPTVTFDYTAEGWQSSRTPGTSSGQPDATKQILWTYFADGQLKEQKAQHDPKGGTTTYTYDANNQLTRIRGTAGLSGSNPKESPMTVENTYDGFDRVITTRQKKDKETVWKRSTSTYDQNGNVTDRVDDAEEGSSDPNKQGHKQHFEFDLRDRVTQHLDYGTKADSSDDQRISYTYLPAGWEQQRTTAKSNGTGGWTTKQTIDRAYYATGQVYQQTTRDAQGAVTESHTVSYIDSLNRYLDGNIVQDSFTLKGPADMPTACEAASCTASYGYDPRGRLTSHQNGYGDSTSYTLDPTGNITQEVSSATGTRSFTYDGMQQTSMTANGTTEYSFYDTEGNLDCTASITPTTCPQTPGGSGSGSVLTDYTYDYHGQVTNYRGAATSTQGTSSADYSYDVFGRLSEESESHGAFGSTPGSGRTTQFSYEGLSERVSTENLTGMTGGAMGTKSYSYDAFGNKAGMTNAPQGGPTAQYSYGYDVQGNISQLLGESGGAKAAYGYTPYGAQAAGLTKGDTDQTNPLNAYRFMGKRLDSGSGNLQMGARQFGPNRGRFLQPDRYRGALADLGLGLDPLTQNRMALAGSNPINFVEVDGHIAQAIVGGLIGGGVDLGVQLLQNGGDLDQVNWGQVGISAAAGALSGGLSSVVGGAGMSTAGRMAATAAGNAAIEGGATALSNVAAGRPAGEGVARSMAIGGITGGASEGFSRLGSACSFTADTSVVTENGQEAIGDIRVGDMVLAWNEATDTTGSYPVTAVLVHVDPTLVHLMLDGEYLVTTPEHPFFTKERGWVAAGVLQVGEQVRQADGTSGMVQRVELEQRPRVMYNLTVATAHTFFVGDGQWLVHNTCSKPVVAGEAGRFGDLDARAASGDKLTPHHMPQAARQFTSRNDGGALMMDEAEHRLTRTYGSKGRVTNARETAQGLSFRDTLARDIQDVRSIVGSKYDRGIRDLLGYYRTNFPDLMRK